MQARGRDLQTTASISSLPGLCVRISSSLQLIRDASEFSQHRHKFPELQPAECARGAPARPPGEWEQQPPAREPAQDTPGKFAGAIAIAKLAPAFYLLLTPEVHGLSSWHKSDIAVIIRGFFFWRLVVSLRDPTCADLWTESEAGVGPWNSIIRYCGGALERTTQCAIRYADLESSDEDFRERKPPPRRKTIHVWECCQCGLGNIKIQIEQCPACNIFRCANCRTTKVQVR